MTATEIKVAVPTYSAVADPAVNLLFDYFNLRYEFYGRRLVPVVRSYRIGSAVDQRATADELASLGIFAALDAGLTGTTPAPALHQALARQEVISLVGRETVYSDQVLYDELHPYLWGVHPSAEQIWRATSELVCTSLAGRPASHAGASLTTATRKFGLLVESEFVTMTLPMPLAHRALIDGLDACGVTPVVANVRSLANTDQARVAVAGLKDAGVTSVICACYNGPVRFIGAIRSADYEPEIVLPDLGYHMEATERDLQPASSAQWARHVFGVFQQPKALPYQARPFYGAIRQMDPSFALASFDFLVLEGIYRQLLVLAAGIQGAGPTLDPGAFGQALMAMDFPNPGAGQLPYWQPAAGFGAGDHTLHDGVALAWWDPDRASTSIIPTAGRSGSWCFLGGGTRFKPGEIPADAHSRFFDPAEPCR